MTRRSEDLLCPLPGHDHRGELPHWDHPPAAAGGIEATSGDLARYAGACLRPPPGPLGTAIAAAQAPQLPVEAGGHQALAWRVSDDGIRWHTGSTGGSPRPIGFLPSGQVSGLSLLSPPR